VVAEVVVVLRGFGQLDVAELAQPAGEQRRIDVGDIAQLDATGWLP
jgi:hypothetical protein